jgi:predicted transcriptional regulator
MRFKVTPAAEGVLRVLRDVVVHWTRDNEWIALSREAGVVGESLELNLVLGRSPLRYPVRVLESCPVIIEGAVRHRLRLQVEQMAVGR